MNDNGITKNNHESPDPEIRRFQRNISTFRKLAGWTAQDLGDKVNLTKQSIHNLECIPCKVRLTSGNYILLRTAFENEANNRVKDGDIVLRRALDVLLNQEQPDDEETESASKDYLQLAADAKKSGYRKEIIRTMLDSLVPIIGSTVAIIGASWIDHYLDKDKKKK